MNEPLLYEEMVEELRQYVIVGGVGGRQCDSPTGWLPLLFVKPMRRSPRVGSSPFHKASAKESVVCRC